VIKLRQLGSKKLVIRDKWWNMITLATFGITDHPWWLTVFDDIVKQSSWHQ